MGNIESKEEYKKEGVVKCPKCDNESLLFEPEEGEEIQCSRCKEGRLIGRME